MAQPGAPPLFAPVSGPSSAASSASPSFLAISDEARFLSSFLDRTRDLISFTPTQLSSLSPRECDDLALGHATILPLLCSAIHAISAIGVRIEDLFSAGYTLDSQVANSLVDQELRDLRNTVHDLSHRVAPSAVRAPPSQAPLPLQDSRQAPSRPHVVPAPTGPTPFSSHPPPPAPTLMSSMVALRSLIRPLLITPPGAKARASLRHSLLVPPLLKSRTPSRPPPPRALLLSPARSEGSCPPHCSSPPP